MSKRLAVSIVIPAYNEVDQIGRCLEAIADQTSKPDQVIVVDNNSNDGTAAIATRFPFVTVVCEKRQGVVHARNTGFDMACGDIIGRVDADTIVAPDWVATTRRIFANSNVGAVSGSVGYHHAPYAKFFSKIDSGLRHYLAWSLGSEVALQGANMAVRASAWRASRGRMCNRGGLHEDFDLSIHLREAGFSTKFEPSLRVTVAFRQAGTSWPSFARYTMLSSGTYAQHNRWRRIYMYPVVGLALVSYPLLRILYLGYDEQKDGFSVRTWLRASGVSRVNPATFVD